MKMEMLQVRETPDEKQTQVRVSVRFRNERMLAARERLGLSQKALADITGVSLHVVIAIEKFDLSHKNIKQLATRLAGALELDLQDVMPDAMQGETLPADFNGVVNADPARLVDFTHDADRFLSFLPPRERQVVKMRYGIGVADALAPAEIARQLNVTRQYVYQIEQRALQTMQQVADDDNRFENMRSLLQARKFVDSRVTHTKASDAVPSTGRRKCVQRVPEPEPSVNTDATA